MKYLQNHYLKTRPKNNTEIKTPLQSIIYSVIDDSLLKTKPQIIEDILNYLCLKPEEKENIGHLSKKNIEGSIDILTQNGFLKEINGVRLLRFIDSF